MGNSIKRSLPKLSMKWFNLVSLTVAAVVMLAVVLGHKGIDGVIERWSTLDKRWLAVALGCMGGYWLLEGTVLHRLTACLYRGVPFLSSQRTGMIGQLYSALTPFSTGGQPVQVIYMQRDGLDTGGAAAVLTVKSVTYQLGVMIFGVIAVITSYGFFIQFVPAFLWLSLLGFLVNLVVTGGMLLVAISPGLTRKISGGTITLLSKLRIVRDADAAREKTERQFAIFHEGSARFSRRFGTVLWAMLLTMVQLLLLYLVPYCIYRSFHIQGGPVLVHIVAAVAFVSMVASFVPLPGGSGGAEGGFVLCFSIFFLSNDVLVALLLWRLITYYAGILLGTLVMMISRKRQRACIRIPLS